MIKTLQYFLTLTAVWLVGVSCISGLCAAEVAETAQNQSPQLIQHEGLENCYRISPDLYRSGQPDEAGFTRLAAMGVRSVLNLREYHSDVSKAAHTRLIVCEYPLAAGSITEAQLEHTLRIIRGVPKPVLVHCWHGSDRTGATVAAYRIVEQGWAVERAIAEFREDRFGHHEWWYGNLTTLLRSIDWNAMRQRLDAER